MCLKYFPTDSLGTNAEYSGFCREEWPQRSVEEHMSKGFDWKNAKTLSCRHKIERDCGVRFSQLLRLPYFDTINYSVVDPMHNVLLGTYKLMMSI